MTPPPTAADLPDEVAVLVVGAGPSGLMLSAELAVAGTIPLLVDALPEPTRQSRALGFTVRTLEIFEQRGISARFGGLATQEAVHFAGLLIEGRHLSSTFRPASQYPQSRTEETLSGWANDLGVAVQRPWRLVAVEPVGSKYACHLEGPHGSHVVVTRFVVGCDGARSRVRDFMEIDSQRTEASVQMLLGDVRGSNLPDRPFGVKHRSGMVMSAPLGDGCERLIVSDLSRDLGAQGVPVTFEEVAASYENVAGNTLVAQDCVWASSFTDASSLVDSYRVGGMILVGDSAHTHLPAGGQGMNVSIQDAVNLGWKLAGVAQDRLPDEVLDTYETERRPVARNLLTNAAAQGQLFLRGPEIDPLREVLAGLLTIPDVATRLGDSVSGLDVRYELEGHDNDLIGSRVPPGVMQLPDGSDGIAAASSGPALLMLASDTALEDEAAHWKPLLRVTTARVNRPEVDCDMAVAHAVLVRPDGHIAWVGSDPLDLRQQLTTWLGQPATDLLEV